MGIVGWDLISLYNHMAASEKVFILYLLLILLFSLVRSLRLGWKLWLFSPTARASSDQRRTDASDLLAAIALANKLPTNDETTETPWQVVEGARARFEYLWEQSVIRVAAMRDFAVLTLILSGLVLSYDLMRFLTTYKSKAFMGDFDVAGGPAELLVPVVLGFASAAAFHILSSFYRGALARRRAAWNLFVAKVDSQHKTH